MVVLHRIQARRTSTGKFHGKDLLLENVQRQVAGSPPPRSALEQEPEPGNAGRGLNRPPVV